MCLFPRPGVWLATSVAVLASAFADDEEQGKGQGKGKGDKGSPGVVQLDLSKLPPDLAKQVMSYMAGKGEKGKGKGAQMEAKGKGALQLPPGLANKPENHPGRINWLKAHAAVPQPMAAPQKGKGKSGGEASKYSDLENRLDRVLQEIEEIRKALKKK